MLSLKLKAESLKRKATLSLKLKAKTTLSLKRKHTSYATVLNIVIFDKKPHGSMEVAVIRQRNSVAKRHRTECETMPNPTQAPGAARSVGGNAPPMIWRAGRATENSPQAIKLYMTSTVIKNKTIKNLYNQYPFLYFHHHNNIHLLY